jgi:hypothetical protein
VKLLKSITGLKTVNLYHTTVSQKGYTELQQALPDCKIVFDANSSPNARKATKL